MMTDKIFKHPIYILIIVFILLSINGAMLERGQYLLGGSLMALQLPWFIINVINRLPND